MGYENFIRCLFLVAGSLYAFAGFYVLVSRLKADLKRKDMYQQLQKFMLLYYSNGEKNDIDLSSAEFRELLRLQCQILYDCYVSNDQYLSKLFYSADDILIKFISTIEPTYKIDLIKYELCRCFSEERQEPAEVKQKSDKDSKISNIIGITGIGVTVIGIIATILSLF